MDMPKQATLSYGHGEITLALPAEPSWSWLKGCKVGPARESECLSEGVAGLRSELSSRKLTRGARVLLVVPDHTRRCRLEVLLPPLLAMLEEAFSAKVEILVAAGTHATVSEAELSFLVGPRVHAAYPVRQHDCRRESELSPFGTTRRGTPVRLNSSLQRADMIITVGGVLFHYFAGFGGGPKMIFPGLAGYESVRQNHALSLDLEAGRLHPGCREGELDANPLFQDICEAAARVPNVVSWQLLLDAEGTLCSGAVGDLFTAHRSIYERARALYALPLPERAPLVLASAGGHPADVDLIQAHKAIHHAHAAVRPGGWLVMLAECGRGIGSKTFMDHFPAAGGKVCTASAIAARLRAEYRLNGQTALALRTKAESANIILISSLDPVLVSRTGMIPAARAEEAWEIIHAHGGELRGKAFIFPRASLFVPALP